MKNLYFPLFAVALIALVQNATAFDLKVWPAKLHIKPGQTQQVTVSVDKLPEGVKSAEIECTVQTGIAKTVIKKTGTASPGNPMLFEFQPDREWGYEIKAKAEAGDQIAEASEVFACAKNVYMISPDYGGGLVNDFDTLPDGTPNPDGQPPRDNYTKERINKMLAFDRNEYIPVTEIGPAQCSFAAIKPLQSNYFIGGGYKGSVNANKYYINQAHDLGISVVFYVNACLKGPAGTEFAREHPQYLTYVPSGTPHGEVFIENYLANKEYIDTYPAGLKRMAKDRAFEKLLVAGYPGFLNVGVDFGDPEVAQYGTRAIIEGVKFWGGDGVRFDGMYQVPSIGDPLAPSRDLRNYRGEMQTTGVAGEDLSLRNFRLFFDTVNKEIPNMLVGVNWAGFRQDQCPGVPEEAKLNKAQSPGVCILDEVAKGSLECTSPTYKWNGFVEVMKQQVDSTRKVDNHLFAGWGGGPGFHEVDMKEIKSFSYACGLRWIRGGWSRDPLSRDVSRVWNRHAMRYSEFVFNNALKRVPKAEVEKTMQLTSDRPVAWSDFVSRLTNDTGSFMVIHLVNSPLEDHQTVVAVAPPPAGNITLSIDPAIFKDAKAVVDEIAILDPELAPVLKSEAKMKNGKLNIPVPATAYWKTIVIPLKKK